MITNKEKDVLLKMSRQEITFLANIPENLSDNSPLPYMLFGNSETGYGRSAVFNYTTPIIKWNIQTQYSLQNGELTSIQVDRSKIPTRFLGKNGEITEETTEWAIEQVANKKMTAQECVAIIRQRNGIISTNNRYKIQLPIPEDNRNIGPLVWGPTDNARYEFTLGNADAKKEILALNRAYGSAEIMKKYGADVESGLKSGKYHIEETSQKQVIIYKWVPNPYYERQLNDVDLDGIPNNIDTSVSDYVVPTYIKEPVLPDLSPFIGMGFTNEEISLTLYYLDVVSAGVDTSGKKNSDRGYGLLDKKIQDLVSSNTYDTKKKSEFGESVYGLKNHAYGAFFTTFAIVTILNSLRDRFRIPALIFGNWSQKGVIQFLEGPLETGLTGFKVFKGIATEDLITTIRDMGVYQLGHVLGHALPHKISVYRLGAGRAAARAAAGIARAGVVIEIPWVGWALAGCVILYDIFAPMIAESIAESERQSNFVDACRVRRDKNGNETINDPGLVYFSNGKIQKEYIINRDYKNKGTTIGAEKDPNSGTYLFDRKTKKIIRIIVRSPSLPPPTQRGGIPGKTVPRLISPDDIGYNTVNEKLIQSSIESNVLQLNLTNKIIAENLSNKTYAPQSSNSLPPPPTFPDGISEDREDLDTSSNLLPYYDTDLAFSNDLQSDGQIPLSNPLMPRLKFINTGPEIHSPRINDSPDNPSVGSGFSENMTLTIEPT